MTLFFFCGEARLTIYWSIKLGEAELRMITSFSFLLEFFER